MLLFVLGIFELLFSNTKLLEYDAEGFVGGDFAGDGADGGDGVAQVLGDKVGWCAVKEAGSDIDKGGLCLGESIEMTDICHENGIGCGLQSVFLGVGKRFFQRIETKTALG